MSVLFSISACRSNTGLHRAYDQCHACRTPLTQEDKQRASFEHGVSCLHCIDAHDDADRTVFVSAKANTPVERTRASPYWQGGAALTSVTKRARIAGAVQFQAVPYECARMALGVAGIACELREVLLRDKPAEMLALSEKGTVPVLHLPNGQVIDESLDVMHWALAQHDPLGWLDAPDLQSWVTLFDETFKHHLDRYKYASRYDGADAKTHRSAARDVLVELEPHLEEGWIGGVQPRFPILRYCRLCANTGLLIRSGLTINWVCQMCKNG